MSSNINGIIDEVIKSKLSIRIERDNKEEFYFCHNNEIHLQQKGEFTNKLRNVLSRYEPGLYYLKGEMMISSGHSIIRLAGFPGQCGAVIAFDFSMFDLSGHPDINETNDNNVIMKAFISISKHLGYSNITLTLTERQVYKIKMVEDCGFKVVNTFENSRTGKIILTYILNL